MISSILRFSASDTRFSASCKKSHILSNCQAAGNVKRVDLTSRDLDVLRELSHGCTNDEIAAKLGISVNTVRTHIQNILNKTGFKNRLALVVNVASLGIVVSDERRMRVNSE